MSGSCVIGRVRPAHHARHESAWRRRAHASPSAASPLLARRAHSASPGGDVHAAPMYRATAVCSPASKSGGPRGHVVEAVDHCGAPTCAICFHPGQSARAAALCLPPVVHAQSSHTYIASRGRARRLLFVAPPVHSSHPGHRRGTRGAPLRGGRHSWPPSPCHPQVYVRGLRAKESRPGLERLSPRRDGIDHRVRMVHSRWQRRCGDPSGVGRASPRAAMPARRARRSSSTTVASATKAGRGELDPLTDNTEQYVGLCRRHIGTSRLSSTSMARSPRLTTSVLTRPHCSSTNGDRTGRRQSRWGIAGT